VSPETTVYVSLEDDEAVEAESEELELLENDRF
jgi:hypothetical protein